MILDYTTPREVHIDMREYVTNMIKDFPEQITTTAATPASEFLFKTNENPDRLKKVDKETFHTFVAKGLFLCKRARPDIQTAIVFLTTRVKEPDSDDWKKLRRMMMYLKGTQDMILKLSADNSRILKWHIDASYAVHPNMRSHTGGRLNMERGKVLGKSTKQKLNMKSSTEAKLVSVDDYMSHII